MSDRLWDDAVQNDNKESFDVGNGYLLNISKDDKKEATLLRNGTWIKNVDLTDKVAISLFIVELVECGIIQRRLAKALNISRQTIHNYIETKKIFGIEGLVHSYKLSESKDRRKQRKSNSDKLMHDNTAKKLAESRKKENLEMENNNINLNFTSPDEGDTCSFPAGGSSCKSVISDTPFSNEHGWRKSRYTGIVIYLCYFLYHNIFNLIFDLFREAYKIFMVFILMVAFNIRSIEQLKNIRSDEAGNILGIKKIPSKSKVWEWFYNASEEERSNSLLSSYFRSQIQQGNVNTCVLFTDGHLLPYTGKERLHYSYNTQRRMPVPGRTNMVTCDCNGKIVHSEMEEGKGDMKNYIIELAKKLKTELPKTPVMVFDREGYGAKYFSELVLERIPFVTWDKYVDSKSLKKIVDKKYKEHFIFNSKNYSIFEEEKSFTYTPKGSDADSKEKHTFNLRHIHIWNKNAKRRTCGLAFSDKKQMSTLDCAQAILARWGASENTFKHCADRHPLHYNPGFKLVESEKQEIMNPKIKEKQKIIKTIQNGLSKSYKRLTQTKETLNQDGKSRQNSKTEKLKIIIEQGEATLKELIEEKKELPERVNVSNLENHKPFKCIDNEGKKLFDFILSSIWNVRKQMIDILRPLYDNENDLIDLFYTITKCHGWVKSSKTEVIFRLEPLQQSRRRLAQEKFCRKLTSLGVQTPNGKFLRIEVGNRPT